VSLVAPVKFLYPQPVDESKPLFIFLPGMDGSGRLLRPQIEKLAPLFDIRCLALNHHCKSDWNTLTHQVNELIIEEIGQRTARERQIFLCGESFGGCLAMQLLSIAPDLFQRVILINPASSFRKLPWMQLGSMITRRLPSMAYRYSSQGIVPFLIEAGRVDGRERVALTNAMEAVPAETAAWRMSQLSKFEVERLPLERMMHPVLLIAGGSDRLLPSKREAKSLMARFPNAQLVLLPQSGHACLLETETNLQQILEKENFLSP